MNKKKLGFFVVFLVFFILLINWLAMEFHWYYFLPWFDIPMHFLGGFWVAILFIFLLPLRKYSFKYVFLILSCVLFVGVLWELFEITLNSITLRDSFDRIDTISDLLFDLLGGFIALFIFHKKK